ncbi:MAG: Gfo/Idh/MocA family oxidoreductase [Gammaproteobacteria bacterium]|nr:Gfo/Idh/MocA family oxidoreductase [Gammaproteobacteria bacterium]
MVDADEWSVSENGGDCTRTTDFPVFDQAGRCRSDGRLNQPWGLVYNSQRYVCNAISDAQYARFLCGLWPCVRYGYQKLSEINTIRVGVIGVGYLGRIHTKIYARMPEVELVGVADIDSNAASSVAQQYECKSYTDPNALLGQVDAVSIVVPTVVHKEVSLPYLATGVHVLLEKPVADTVKDAEVIIEEAEKRNVVLQIGHLERFNAGVMTLADLVRVPRFIEVHRLSTFVERATDVDVVTDLMIHDIDIVLSLVRSELSCVSAMGTPVVTDHVDIANARLEFKNGAVANVTASRVSNKKFRRIRIFSEDGYRALNFTDQQIDIVKTGKRQDGRKYPDIINEQLAVEHSQPLDAELQHFVDTVRTNGVPLVGGRDGLEALKVAIQVKEKIHSSFS